jgi:hypothetical protein
MYIEEAEKEQFHLRVLRGAIGCQSLSAYLDNRA